MWRNEGEADKQMQNRCKTGRSDMRWREWWRGGKYAETDGDEESKIKRIRDGIMKNGTKRGRKNTC